MPWPVLFAPIFPHFSSTERHQEQEWRPEGEVGEVELEEDHDHDHYNNDDDDDDNNNNIEFYIDPELAARFRATEKRRAERARARAEAEASAELARRLALAPHALPPGQRKADLERKRRLELYGPLAGEVMAEEARVNLHYDRTRAEMNPKPFPSKI